MKITYQKPFAPGMTPAKRDLQNVYYDLLQLQQKVAHLTAAVEADPSYWNVIHLKARRNAVVDAEARLAKCQARVAAEAAQEATA
jgi:hypothetical protein